MNSSILKFVTCRKVFVIILIVSVLSLSFFYTHIMDYYKTLTQPVTVKPSYWTSVANRTAVIIEAEQRLIRAIKYDKGAGCEVPDVDPFSKEILKFDKPAQKLVCNRPTWVKCHIHRCNVTQEILSTYTNIECVYTPLIYVTDAKYILGTRKTVYGSHYYELIKSDHVKVKCNGITRNNEMKSWEGIGIGFRSNVKKKVPPGRENSYNVLMFGFDSTSHNGFIRSMPKTYQYLKQELNATILRRHNIVGDGTPAAMFPMMTGHNELELPDIRRPRGNHTADELPFIFYKVSDDGYYTAYFEDMTWVGTFNFRFNGFKKAPADYYLNIPFTVEKVLMEHLWQKRDVRRFCSGDIARHILMMKLTEKFFHQRGKKFCYTFIADITHDNFYMLKVADDSTLQFLKSLSRAGHFRNTLLIFMGDHGDRYQSSGVRKTLQGKIEERLPLMAILLPENLRKERPEAFDNLRNNARTLTTPYDIHSTILDVIGLNQFRNDYKVPGADLTRGQSLLNLIPHNRSCSEAGVQAHWCTCITWENMTNNNDLYKRIADSLVDYINSLTADLRSKCAIRTLKSIHWVLKQKLNANLMSFLDSSDRDGYVVRNGSFPPSWQVYQVKVEVGPGSAFYEASLTYYNKEREFHVDGKDISRTNPYGDEPHCVLNTNVYLLPYCYCREDFSGTGVTIN